MRINDKRKLESCLESLFEIKEQLRLISTKERQNILPLCQQMAVEMGNMIEEKEGEGTTAVFWLEKYCEEVYYMYTAEEALAVNASYDRLSTLLEEIAKEISGISEEPLEILFLPYKAAMWDSMESVYQAAIKQQGCHITVMPIPYYNVNPQEEILSVKYEGKLFPKEVIITDFTSYDLKRMQPDAIFIHNPYDQYNYVTRIASDYYSTELVKYTKRLVYLPYFITSRNEIAGHYCVLPGVKNAWRTFVQSEEVRKGYQQYVRNKDSIVALGSPKFDKVKQIAGTFEKVPVGWKKVLEGKKVFLLNTHLNNWISNAEESINKLENLFYFFSERRECVLLWRPHPLSLETIKSLNPSVAEKYLELVEQFKMMQIGIYDESPDIHRAIAVSDGYIGNISSVISLYGVTGKPIYILAVNENNLWKKDIEYKAELKRNEIEEKMRTAIEPIRYLYYESDISLEDYVELVKNGQDFCRQERKKRFTDLQYDFNMEETAGERIWKYVYKDIIGEEFV